MGIGKPAGILLGLLAITGCDSVMRPEVIECESTIKANLRSPSTYKRIKADTLLMDAQKPAEVWVSIEYDADNAFGTPIRGTEICKYPAKDGRADLARYNRELSEQAGKDADGALAAASQAASEAAAAASAAAKAAGDAAALPPKVQRRQYPYVADDGVDIRDAQDAANWEKYGTTDPDGGE